MRAHLACAALFGTVAFYFLLTGSLKTRAASCLILAGTIAAEWNRRALEIHA